MLENNKDSYLIKTSIKRTDCTKKTVIFRFGKRPIPKSNNYLSKTTKILTLI